MLTIKPASNQLFCKPDKAETVTKSGFILAESAVDAPKTAEVINVGSGVKQFVQKDRVIYKAYSTTDITLEGVEYFLVSEDDILGVITEVE